MQRLTEHIPKRIAFTPQRGTGPKADSFPERMRRERSCLGWGCLGWGVASGLAGEHLTPIDAHFERIGKSN